MQAVILVGGRGTRLRPLTIHRPKPIVPFVDRPFMAYMLEWVASHGIEEVVMCCGFLADAMVEEIGDGSRYGVRITWVEEAEPRGTAGALKLAEKHLNERFVVLNGDVLTDLDLTAQIARHEANGAVGSLALVPVENPAAYGLVRLHRDDRVAGFVEKPPIDEIDTDLISAGVYVLEQSVLSMIPAGRMVSIEREIWPRLVDAGLYGCVHRGSYWMDIGTPEHYIQGSADILAGRVRTRVTERLDAGPVDPTATVAEGSVVDRAALVDRGARIGSRVWVGAGSVVGPDVRLGDDVILERAIVLEGAIVASGCRLRDCVVGMGAELRANTHLADGAMVGDAALVGEGNVLAHGARVAPGVTLPPEALF